jgi:hypothetical protein
MARRVPSPQRSAPRSPVLRAVTHKAAALGGIARPPGAVRHGETRQSPQVAGTTRRADCHCDGVCIGRLSGPHR